uniref:outer membrane beta-barrel protein n=1 Tax=Massilia alkalitolerans TaxID=286638 RepID=UPI0028AE345F
MPTNSHFASHSRYPRRSLIAHLVAGTLLAPFAASAQQAPAVQEQPKQEAAKPAQAPVQAQAAQAAAAPPAQTPVESTVTVSATRTQNRIDRQSYDVKADPATSVDTVADTLNKVPSVAVDGDGNVTLRGRNVQILVDGKPSAMMQGENRAAAINALPAGDLDSVEVINNPGAQFGNEGGGGPIINLVMRRERSPGGFATVSANVGTEGRYRTSVFGNYTQGRYSVQGNLARSKNRNENSGELQRERIDPVTGAIARSTSLSNGVNESENTSANGGLTYNWGDKDVIGLTANYSQVDEEGESNNRYSDSNAADVVNYEYVNTALRARKQRSYGLGARLDHKGDAPGEKFQMDLRLSGSDVDSASRNNYTYTVRPARLGTPVVYQTGATETRVADLTGDYELPGENGVLKVGYKVARNENVFDNVFFDLDPVTGAERMSTSRTNRFELNDTTYALYGTYQWRVNENWGVLGGLRTEYAELDMNQVTTGMRATNHYFDAIPSAFVTY